MKKSVLIILAGPTAAGKTELSLTLAERRDAEIISADSRQIFKRLNVGTAKPTPVELARVPHHFIDVLEPGTPYSAGRYADDAWKRAAEVLGRGKTPLFVGGSTLYLEALQFGLANIPDVDPVYRDLMMNRLNEEGAERLFDELVRVDPATAATLDATKTQRLVRALEIYHGSGRPLSSYFTDHPEPPFDFRTFVLHRPLEPLYVRIAQRVDAMIQQGLVDEVRGLLTSGVDPSWNALRTIGYRETIDYLHGKFSLEEMTERIKRNTRHYARRQLTWFRRWPDGMWLDLSAGFERPLEAIQAATTG